MRATKANFSGYSLYEDAIRRRVCEHCIDYGEDGTCHSLDPEGCAILLNLPELVSIAQQIHASQMDPYESAVRERICAACPHGSGGRCPYRESLDCGLNRYLPLVLEALEEVQAGAL